MTFYWFKSLYLHFSNPLYSVICLIFTASHSWNHNNLSVIIILLKYAPTSEFEEIIAFLSYLHVLLSCLYRYVWNNVCGFVVPQACMWILFCNHISSRCINDGLIAIVPNFHHETRSTICQFMPCVSKTSIYRILNQLSRLSPHVLCSILFPL